MNKLARSTVKGVITAAVVIIALTVAFKAGITSNNFIYLVYGLYSAGIIWAILSFKKAGNEDANFKTLFNEGFKCFIVVVLFMMVYTFVMFKLNSATEAEYYRQSITAEKNKTPGEIDDAVKQFIKFSPIFRASGAMFFYLVIGALVAGVTAGAAGKKELV